MKLKIFLILTIGLIPMVAHGAALPGDETLLEPKGTTIVSSTHEKVLYSYTIRPGDTLWDIARWTLKDPFQWPEFLKYNYIANPDLIYPGVKLTVPSPEVLERIKHAKDIDEIEQIRQQTEKGAVVKELGPMPEDEKKQEPIKPLVPIATPTELVKVPRVDPESNTETTSDLKITGQKSMMFRYQENSGEGNNLYQSSGFTRNESLSLNISGQLMEKVKVDGSFYQSDQTLENKYHLKLSTDKMELYLGDYAAAIPMTSFLLNSKQLSGGNFKADFNKWGIDLLVGSSKGTAQLDRFFGNRTQGPYYLKNAPVVVDSEQVMIDKEKLIKGSDFQIDYTTGSITFLKEAVSDIALVEVIYESRQTVFSRSLYAGRVWGKPLDWLTIGTSVAREEDSRNEGVVTTANGNTVTPFGHWVAGNDIKAEVPNFGTVQSEWAFSQYQSNLFDDEKEEGFAADAKASGAISFLGLKANYSRTTPQFQKIGDQLLGKDVLAYGGLLDVKTGGPYYLAAEYDYKENLLEHIRETREQASLDGKLMLKKWPRLGYQYYQLKENKGNSSTVNMDYQTNRHSGTIDYEQDYYQTTLRAELEERTGSLSDRSSAKTNRLSLGANSKNISWMTFSSFWEYEQVSEATNSSNALSDYKVNKLVLSGAFTPHENYRLTADNRWVWDEAYGSTRTLDTKATIKPIKQVGMDAKYSLENMQSLVGATYQPIYTQTVSGQLDITPLQALGLHYTPSYRWSELADRDGLLNKTRTDLATLKWAMLPSISHELEAKYDLYVMTNQTEETLPIQSEQNTRKGTYRLRASINQTLSANSSYEYEMTNRYNHVLEETKETKGLNRKATVQLKSALSETFRIDTNYSLSIQEQFSDQPEKVTRTAYPISDIGQTINNFNQINSYGSTQTRKDTVDIKATYEWTEVFSTYITGLYDRNEDLTGLEDLIHTGSAGIGATWRWQLLRVEVNSKLAKSWGEAETYQESYNAMVSYNPIKLISLSLKLSHSRNLNPDMLSNEGTLNCSVRF